MAPPGLIGPPSLPGSTRKGEHPHCFISVSPTTSESSDLGLDHSFTRPLSLWLLPSPPPDTAAPGSWSCPPGTPRGLPKDHLLGRPSVTIWFVSLPECVVPHRACHLSCLCRLHVVVLCVCYVDSPSEMLPGGREISPASFTVLASEPGTALGTQTPSVPQSTLVL